MAPPPYAYFAISTASSTSSSTIAPRSLSDVNRTQAITLGVMAVYVVVIAALWNIPYVRYVLWPFKVRPFQHLLY